MGRDLPLNRTRNIGIMAHIDAGKTTLTERILYYTGKTYKMGEVHDGTAEMDWMVQEKERGITITAAATTCFWRNARINIIDTPGHVDFTVEVERSLRVLDSSIAVFDAVAGVEPQSETVWRQADKYHIPRICFINKMDRVGADFERSIDMIREKLFSEPLCLQIPILKSNDEFVGVVDILQMKGLAWDDDLGEKYEEIPIPENLLSTVETYRDKLIETLAEYDDEIMEKFIEGFPVDIESMKSAIRRVTISSKAFPVFCGSALKNKGVQPILDAIIDYLPSPRDMKPVEGHNPKISDDLLFRKPEDKDSFCALVFKISSDTYVGKLSYARIYSGNVKTGDIVLNVTTNKKERIGRILRMHANDREDVKEVFTGDIVALVGVKSVRTGDTLSDVDNPILLEKMEFPEPVISKRFEPKTKAEAEKFKSVLQRLEDEDPTFKVKYDPDTGETLIFGMGELHLEIIVDRLTREFNIHANIGKPQVTYKETITKNCRSEYKYTNNIGGVDQFGHVVIEMEPLKPGTGFIFENRLVNDEIPQIFISIIEDGLKDAMKAGVLAGYEMMDIKTSLIGGSYDQNKSVDIAYRIAANMAFKDGARRSEPSLLEPIMKLEVVSPEEYTGDIINDLNSRRARVEGIDMLKLLKVINALVPLSEVFGYATRLRSISQGRASHTLQFSHYDIVPKNIIENIVGKMTGRISTNLSS
ncbi:MAG: elongation factor G [Spirochaetota bacterium]|nr:elongation factor G [Spirochaetota bacterium]